MTSALFRNDKESAIKPLKLQNYIEALIEGDGSIKVPNDLRSKKGKLLYPSLTITFVVKDLELAKLIAQILKGTINKGSGDWLILSIYRHSALYDFALLVNGKFRTPKIEALHRLITWLNNSGKFDQLEQLPADKSSIISGAWLAGFSDCDANFLISYSISPQGIAKNIHLTYRLSPRQEYHRMSPVTGVSYLPVLSSIASVFKTKVTLYSNERLNSNTNTTYLETGYLVTIKSLISRLALINYFSNFNMLSSKHLDYLDWVEAHELIGSRSYRRIEGTTKLQELKYSMNSNRTKFNLGTFK